MNSSEYTKKVEEKKQSSSLYALCILVGLGVGFIVSFYRWGLEKISHLREELFVDVSLDEPLSLFESLGDIYIYRFYS